MTFIELQTLLEWAKANGAASFEVSLGSEGLSGVKVSFYPSARPEMLNLQQPQDAMSRLDKALGMKFEESIK